MTSISGDMRVETTNVEAPGPNQQLYLNTVQQAANDIRDATIRKCYSVSDAAQNTPEALNGRVQQCVNLTSTPMGMLSICQNRQVLTSLLGNAQFLEAPSDPEKQKTIASLDERSSRFFWSTTMAGYAELEKAGALKPILFTCALEKKGQAHVQVISELALPIIQKAIQQLDEKNPNILDQAKPDPEECTPGGHHVNVQQYLRQFGVQLP